MAQILPPPHHDSCCLHNHCDSVIANGILSDQPQDQINKKIDIFIIIIYKFFVAHILALLYDESLYSRPFRYRLRSRTRM